MHVPGRIRFGRMDRIAWTQGLRRLVSMQIALEEMTGRSYGRGVCASRTLVHPAHDEVDGVVLLAGLDDISCRHGLSDEIFSETLRTVNDAISSALPARPPSTGWP